MDRKIISYYLLCTAKLGRKRHIVSELVDSHARNVFTAAEMDIYFRKYGVAESQDYIPRESVVGGRARARTHAEYEPPAIDALVRDIQISGAYEQAKNNTAYARNADTEVAHLFV